MEPLFLSVISGCHAGLFREALPEVYISRIQRGNACFAANILGARGSFAFGNSSQTTVGKKRARPEDDLISDYLFDLSMLL